MIFFTSRKVCVDVLSLLVVSLLAGITGAQTPITVRNNMVLDSSALLMPASAPFGRAINGVSFQDSPLLTVGNYQYAAWYEHVPSPRQQNLILGRRNLNGTSWERFDTGFELENGDSTGRRQSLGDTNSDSLNWDAHNVASIGISDDGRMHVAFDLHTDQLKYIQTAPGTATATNWLRDSIFQDANFNNDLNGLPGVALNRVTYPRFISNPGGDLIMTYRTDSSGNGDMNLATFDQNTGLWSDSNVFIQGRGSIFYNDPGGPGSNERNAYLNGLDVGPDGTLHTTFTWRERSGGANHDINYISSRDGGATWENSAGVNLGSAVDLNSDTIIGSDVNPTNPLGRLDRNQTLMNQQGQAVDTFGGVHALMWHRQEGTFGDGFGDNTFNTRDAAHFHYYRDPTSGEWTQNQLPLEDAAGNPVDVSSRPKIGYDENGDLYAVYVSPGTASNSTTNFYDDGFLVVAGATKDSNYEDWSIIWQDRDTEYSGEPLIDQTRLIRDGVLSVFIQESSSNNAETGTDLRVIEFDLGRDGDFNNDGIYDCQDIDALTTELAAGGDSISFDLNADGIVDDSDLDAWLAEAGEENLASGNPFLRADANLDGVVDGSDFNIWNKNKFTTSSNYCHADFNADGSVDGSDFNLWNQNKFAASDIAAVPEPSFCAWWLIACAYACNAARLRRRSRTTA